MEVAGKAQLKGAQTRDKEFNDLMKEHRCVVCVLCILFLYHNFYLNREFAGFDQFLPGQSRNVTYVSRLQCIQVSLKIFIS